MKPGLSTTTALSGMQRRNLPGGQAMQGWALYEGEPPPPPPPAPPPPPPAVHHTPPPPPPAVHQPPPVQSDRIEDVRAEAASYRIKARDEAAARVAAEARATQIQQEADQRVRDAEARAGTTTNKIKERTRDAELRAAATAAGIRDPDLIPLIDKSTITIDDEGNVTGAAEAVAAFKTKKPEFFGSAAPPPPPPRTGPPGSPPTPQNNLPPTSVTTIPRTPEGDRTYKAQKADALRALK